MSTPLRALALCAVLLLVLTPAVGHADSKGKGKGASKTPAVQARGISIPQPAPAPQPAPVVEPSAAPSSNGTITTEEARALIAADAQLAALDPNAVPLVSEIAPGFASPLPLQPTPRPTPFPAPSKPRALPTARPTPDILSLPAWPFVALLCLSAPAVALTVLCVRRAGPMVRFLNT